MIKIKKSPTADSRNCDFSKVSKQKLLQSTRSHISDVKQGMYWVALKIIEASQKHDFTKIQNIDLFYKDFITNFNNTQWWQLHQKEERHHILAPLGEKEDIDLIDVLQFLVDGVMAGLARSGDYKYSEIPSELLQQAFYNTVKKLINNIVIINQ